MATRRGKDLRIQYDADTGEIRTVAQRTYRDGNDIELTPITPALQARLITGVPVDRSRLKPRVAVCCIPNEANVNGRSDMRVIIPYLPASAAHSGHLQELLAHSNGPYTVAAIEYFSEALG